MNKREVFETVKAHLLTQPHRSIEDGVCAYRGPNGEKCAIGVLIPDEAYHVGLEGKGATHDDVLKATGLEITGVEDKNFLSQLQIIHDDVPVRDWAVELDAFERRAL